MVGASTFAVGLALQVVGASGGTVAADDCLGDLRARKIGFERLDATEGVDTPVVIKGALGAISLEPRGKRAAVMDCTLARALAASSGIFKAAGLTRLEFSAVYDHRLRRDSSQMSAHAFGRAIDVHAFNGTAGRHDVKQDFEAGVGQWQGLVPADGALAACIGAPRSERGRTLRTLVCRLKLETELRIIVTPDDNEDHRDHVHLEYVAAPAPRLAPTAPVVKKAKRPLAKKKQKKKIKRGKKKRARR